MRGYLLILLVALLVSPAMADYPDTDEQDSMLIAARGQINSGDVAGAIETLERLVLLRPDDADVLSVLGYAHRLLGEIAPSRRYYNRALEADPDHRAALSYAGILEWTSGNRALARRYRARLATLCPEGCASLALLDDVIDAH
ncbi:tetratricopeptide repeat protein [Pontivivens insulae]|uniref:Uncharacterized protein n=1 Tax=Pontivivens insulae TaxID=1639689 RepID=A0A2R8AE81_9RHOB|nr:tetratricopeptide repeat protein [Pontivivens insulae]RED11804.1 tetratricopeptide repeat protein [Pontivivens insulae]SPF30561.1 hypothetical protein POI8812_02900 [Pontivivens insulae]